MLRKVKGLFEKMFHKLAFSLQRFPETLLLTLGLVITGILLNHLDNDNQVTLGKFLLVFLMGMPISADVVLLTERFNLKMKLRALMDGVLVLGLGLFYWQIPDPMTPQFGLRCGVLIAIFYLLFTLIPYFFNRSMYALYCIKLIVSFFITYLYTAVLFAGVSALIFTIDRLFNLQMDNRIYADFFFISAGIFGVSYFLGNVPRLAEEMIREAYPKVVKVLFVAIVMPLLTAYSVILYAYFAKILISQKWPEGLVGNLVLWYGWISFFVLFCVFDIGEKKSWTAFFKRFFPFAFIIPLGMLFSTIWIRTQAYGLTVPRYYVWLSGIWFLIILIYFIINKWQKMTFITTTLIIFLFISAFGPFSGFGMSIRSQSRLLENALVELNMLEDGKILKRTDLSATEKGKIQSPLEYLQRVEAFNQIEYLPKDFKLSQSEEVFGFDYNYEYASEQKYFNYSYNTESYVVDTKAYDYMVNLVIYYDHNGVRIDEAPLQVTLSKEGLLTVIYNEKEIASDAMYDRIYQLHEKLNNKMINNKEELMYTFETEAATIMVEWVSLDGDISNEQTVNVNNMVARVWIDLH